MVEKLERTLVSGTVNLEIDLFNILGVVTPDIANNEELLKEWIKTNIYKVIDDSDYVINIGYSTDIKISKETADKLTGEVISPLEWNNLIFEDKN